MASVTDHIPHGPGATRRRRLLQALLTAALGALVPGPLRAAARGARADTPHPEPRRGYGAAKVLAADQLGGNEELIALFDGIRKIPQIADGIRCKCGCASLEGMYSLLSCYEGKDAMALWCPICQGEGAVAVRLHRQGRTLAQIREAIDARF